MMRSKTYIATPPGATIKEQLVERNMSQKEFAVRMNMSEKHISRLINGEVQLTPETAMRLEMVLGLPARFWNNLESIYREKLALVQAENEMEEDIQIAKRFPYSEMAKNGWVAYTRSSEEKVMNLRKFFEVVRLDIITGSSLAGINCRRLCESEKCDYALLAWSQKAKLEARTVSVNAINVEKLKSELPHIREMTRQNPIVFCQALREAFSACGIALVFLPHIGGSFLYGATFFDGPKIVVGMTVRGKDADRFWFSIFHEIGHIVLGHLSSEGRDTQETEREADDFAKNILIPEDAYCSFIRSHKFDRWSIQSFADTVGIDAGIVVGRLQKEGHIEFSMHNDLKTRYELVI